MILFPAIDLKDGQCVRLKLGEMDSATVYNEDPAAQARAFEEQGFEWLHVVDLNGAFVSRITDRGPKIGRTCKMATFFHGVFHGVFHGAPSASSSAKKSISALSFAGIG